ncbi:MAG: hypothetical protein Q8Q33_04550 [Chlamydiota bacterium]|nr:hypothetical protein [Chlamydiota bacterium]
MNVFYQDSIIPKKAGLAYLEYAKNIKEPRRDNDVITIPQKGHSLYQLSAGFEQFLIIQDRPEEHDPRYTKPFKVWFGGTDELPFLVRLRNVCSREGREYDWPTVWRNNSFYKEIKPIPVIYAERKKMKVKRQGDIFAVKSPTQSWDDIVLLRDSSRLQSSDYIPNDTKSRSPKSLQLFATRHHLQGEYVKGNDHYMNVPNYYDIICRGTIEAPDHADLVLKDLYMLFQTRNLFEPAKAD